MNEVDIKEFVKPEKKTVKKNTIPDIPFMSGLILLGAVLIIAGVAYTLEWYADWRAGHQYRTPIIIQIPWEDKKIEEKEVIVEPIIEEKKEEVVNPNVWTGQASYYSWDGCVGCNPNRIMANGEQLDDMRKTVAFNRLPMNTEVLITNLTNSLTTKAVVTDTGGFEKLGRIADLSVATKQVIGCSDLCQIRIEKL